MRFTAKGFSEAGRGKPNQDAFLIKSIDDNTLVIAIADGMGGTYGGDIASKLAIDVISEQINTQSGSISSLFSKVKSAIQEKALETPDFERMGTTLTLALIQDNNVTLGHVGDSRLYHLRANGIVSKTKDQTEVQKLLDDGILTKERAKNYHRRNVLLSVLTSSRDYELQMDTFKVEVGDRLVLMTDGAYSLILKKELRDLSLNSSSIDDYLYSIRKMIVSRPIRDDYTVVALEANY
ncbi:PP2C family protein-serine/threonine phosphatase [Shewanella algae]|uniref:PP2C family protein-serine/threonine phosphatase n=1 Tax=Shewanella algae TaxID=38313 RepID=UPI001F1C3AE0|nr:protein phosphatase 2C domain-containing protein [Shewanella algae]MCE9781338.1 protein phosphatase 2C domain-containing protein [Shewanella algae]MCE9825762.1 protein phosphatase 2C domain-containing protein [Shewanella algae]